MDYYSKTLQGRKMFYLLMYGIPESDRLSQRNPEDIFKDAHFKQLFNLEPREKIARSSINVLPKAVRSHVKQQSGHRKKENETGYKTAKRRFRMGIRDMITVLIVIQCGGDPNLFLKQKRNEILPNTTEKLFAPATLH